MFWLTYLQLSLRRQYIGSDTRDSFIKNNEGATIIKALSGKDGNEYYHVGGNWYSGGGDQGNKGGSNGMNGEGENGGIGSGTNISEISLEHFS